ncbi:MAG: hypothetical protein JXA71_01755, partial [Chitinispirillaceae bacterium]|nr:hypothetical protein [Chitinispirillaceae bacterium]
ETAAGINDALLSSFLVYAARRSDGAVRYFGFNEFEPHLRKAMAGELSSHAVRKSRTHPFPVHRERMLNDVAVVAILGCQGVLQKKKQGGLLRTAVQRITHLTGEYSTAGGSENIAGLLTRCGTGSGLLAEGDEAFRCVPDACETWMERPSTDRIRELLDLTVRIAGGWRISLLQETIHSAGDVWLPVTLFPQEDRKRAAEVLVMLSWAGMVMCAQSGGELLFGRPREHERIASRANGDVTIMPDFSVVTAQEASPAVLFRFGRCGRLQSLDCVYKGVIDRAIVCDSIAQGISGETLLDWLVEWGAPPNVTVTVREWIREFNRLYISNNRMLIAGEERVAYQIDSYGPLRDLVEKVPAHAVYRIRKGGEEQVRELLASMGFDYRMPCREDGVISEEPAEETAISPIGWDPVVTEKLPDPQKTITLQRTKYGPALKAYELSETMQVIDYAIVTGQGVKIDYAGSALTKKGMYSITPQSCSRGGDPQLDAVDGKGKRRKFLVGKITRIGIGSS